jgi:hypothetical protein
MQIIQSIQNRIYEIRGERVMLDRDLAALYETETKRLKEAVNRNIKRFPPDFMFQLTKEEWESIKYQADMVESGSSLRTQIASSKKGGVRYMPYVFTEQGVAMLSSAVNSDKAINMNIAIMRAFIEIRKVLLHQNDLKEQLRLVKDKLGERDAQLNQIYDALENILDDESGEWRVEVLTLNSPLSTLHSPLSIFSPTGYTLFCH